MSGKKIFQEQITDIISRSKIDSVKLGAKTTVVHATLPSGFEIVETSSCVDPANYDHEKGTEICLKRIESKIWELEGYLLQARKDEYVECDSCNEVAEYHFCGVHRPD